MLAHATCGGRAPAPRLEALSRHLLIGFQTRAIVEWGDVSVNGRRTAHAVLDGRLATGGALTRVETYVLKDGRCVYDFALVAPPASFETWRAAFRGLVDSFAAEGWGGTLPDAHGRRSEEHTSELQSQSNLVCRLLLEKKKKNSKHIYRAAALYIL